MTDCMIARIAAAQKIADLNDGLDVLARAQFMEGFAGYRANSEVKAIHSNESKMLAFIEAAAKKAYEELKLTSKPSELWWKKGNQQLYTSVLDMAYAKGNQFNLNKTTVESLMMSAMYDPDKWEDSKDKGSIFFNAGLSARKNRTLVAPKPAAKGAIHELKMDIFDEAAKDKNRAILEKDQAATIQEETTGAGVGGYDTEGWSDIADAILDNPTEEVSKAYFDLMSQSMSKVLTDNEIDVANRYFSYLFGDNARKHMTTDTAIAEDMGLANTAYLGKIKKKLSDEAVRRLSTGKAGNIQAFLDKIDDARFLDDLRRGRVRGAIKAAAAIATAKKRMAAMRQAATGPRLLAASDYMAELEKASKFTKGENVSLDELPEELQENVKNPPPGVAALTEKLKAKAASSRVAVDLPPDVERYVEEIQEANPDYDESQAWATAWSIYCVAGDTQIFTSMGLKTVGEIAKKSVMSKVGHGGVMAGEIQTLLTTHQGQGTSSHVVNTGVKPVVTVTTKHGYHLTCTPDHRLLALNTDTYAVEWVTAGDCAGRYMVLPTHGTWGNQVSLGVFAYTAKTHNNVVPLRRPTAMTMDLARVLGYLVAEGSVTEDGLEFSNSDPRVVDDYTRCMVSLFGEAPKTIWTQPAERNRLTKPSAKVRTRTRWYKEFFSSLGLLPCVATEKAIPDAILNAPKEFVAEFLRAFIEGDGWVGSNKQPNRVDLVTASKTLSRQLHLVLSNFGVLTTLEQNARGYYTVRVNSAPMARRFRDTVGGGVFKVPTITDTNGRGGEFECVPAGRIKGLSQRIANEIPGANKISLSRIKSLWPLLETHANDRKVLTNLRSLMDKGYLFDPVTSVSDAGEVEVFDLSVPGDESFVANGLVAHNCKYKNPGSEHCSKPASGYFTGKSAKHDRGPMTAPEKKELFEDNPEFADANKNPSPGVLEIMGKTASNGYVGDSLDEAIQALSLASGGLSYRLPGGGDPLLLKGTPEYVMGSRAYALIEEARKALGNAHKYLARLDLQFSGSSRLGSDRTAASGLYGFTKAAEKSCTGASSKLAKFATKLATDIYTKDADTAAFMAEHTARTGSKLARMLRSEMAKVGPGAPVKTAGRTGNGLYGFKDKTAKLSMEACSELHQEAGRLASDLAGRFGDNQEVGEGFLKKHAKAAKCAFSDLILESYPSSVKLAKAASSDPTVAQILAWDRSVGSRMATSFMASAEDDIMAEDSEGDAEGGGGPYLGRRQVYPGRRDPRLQQTPKVAPCGSGR